MSNVTFRNFPETSAIPYEKRPIQVLVNGKVTGLIRHVPGGFAYYPKGASNQKFHGDTYATLEECKRSLTEEPAEECSQ